MSILDTLEGSALGTWVTQSGAGFYVLLAIHGIGLAMVVGIMMVVCLRVLGLVRGVSPAALPKLTSLSWVGFIINFISGLALFTGEANKMWYNWSFRWKIVLVIVGMITTYTLTKSALRPAAAGDVGKLDTQGARFQALFLMLVWLGVIFAGRWIAYLGQIDVPA